MFLSRDKKQDKDVSNTEHATSWESPSWKFESTDKFTSFDVYKHPVATSNFKWQDYAKRDLKLSECKLVTRF